MTTLAPDPSLEGFYARTMGTAWTPVVVPPDPHVPIRAYDTADLGAPTTLVTCGMSSRPMDAPMAASVRRRVELVSYVPAPEWEFAWWLAWIADFPFSENTWIGHGHTIRGSSPLFDDSELRHFLLLPSLVRQHSDMDRHVRVQGDRVALWWVVPITDAELEHKKRSGLDSLLDAFAAGDLPLVVDPRRGSAV